MKSFIEMQMLDESKDRFWLKNKKLTPGQQQEFIDFTKSHKKFEKLVNDEIGWNRVYMYNYYTFKELKKRAKDTPSAKKKKMKKLRHKGIRGLEEGEDYINVNTKNKYYLTYIPLNYKAAQVIKTVHIGGCEHNGCIGGSQAPKYFKSEGKKKDRVPVYVIGQGDKWVVMMYPTGKHETWAKENNRGDWGEPIPNFDIKKELDTPKLRKLYKEILDVTWGRKGKGKGIPQEEYENADTSYQWMISAVESFYGERIDAKEEHENHNNEQYGIVVEFYKEAIEELEAEYEVSGKVRNRIIGRMEEIKKIIKVEPTGTGTNSSGETVWKLQGVDYTLDDLENTFSYYKERMSVLEDDNNSEGIKIKEKLDEYKDILDDLEGFSGGDYEFEEYARQTMRGELPFDDVWSEEYMFEDVYSGINFNDDSYDDYFEFAEKYLQDQGFDNYDRQDYEQDIYEQESEIVYGGTWNDGEAILTDIGLPSPDEAEGV